MKHSLSILKSLGITAGLNILLLGLILLFTRMVKNEGGQALLFLSLTLLLTLGLCLCALIPAKNRATLWGCFGVSVSIHLLLSIVTALITGKKLSAAWPGDGDLAWILVLLLSLSVWGIGLFWVTVLRTARIGRVRRESKRQLRRAIKGYTKEWQTLSPARARLVAVLRGALWVIWLHLLTTLLYDGLTEAGLEDTMLSYIAFPVLWSLMAAWYVYDRDRRRAYALSAAVTNLAFFLLPTILLTVVNTPVHKYRFILHLDSVLTKPMHNPEQMLVIGVFLTVWVAMIVFGAGNKRKNL